jgi:hypothetical protein
LYWIKKSDLKENNDRKHIEKYWNWNEEKDYLGNNSWNGQYFVLGTKAGIDKALMLDLIDMNYLNIVFNSNLKCFISNVGGMRRDHGKDFWKFKSHNAHRWRFEKWS